MSEQAMVYYRYDRPGPAGPFKGNFVWQSDDPVPKKGESIYAAFGSATVTAVRAMQPTKQ